MDLSGALAELRKAISNTDRLNYFKRELTKILDAQEKNDSIVSKAIELYDNSMAKSLLSEYGIAKSNYPIGTVRIWKGKKFRKIAPGKWRRVYDKEDRGAKQSIAYLKKRIAGASSTDELLQLVMENTSRFMDEKGQLLPIVEELRKEVQQKKVTLNINKPSVQQQINDFNNKKNNVERFVPSIIQKKDIDNVASKVRGNELKVGDYICRYGIYHYNVEKIDGISKVEGKNRFYVHTDKGTDTVYDEDNFVYRIKDSVTFVKTDIDKFIERYDSLSKEDNLEKRYLGRIELVSDVATKIDDITEQIDNADNWEKEQELYAERNNYVEIQRKLNKEISEDYWNLPENKKKFDELENRLDSEQAEFMERFEEIEKIPDLDERHKERKELIKDIKAYNSGIDKEMEDLTTSDPRWDLLDKMRRQMNSVIDKLKLLGERQASQRPSVLKQFESITNVKTYTPEEIAKAREESDSIKAVFTSKWKEMYDLNQEANKLNRYTVWMREKTPEEQKEEEERENKKKELRDKADAIEQELKQMSKRLDTLLDPLLDDIINTPYDTSKIDECKTADEVGALLSFSDFYNPQSAEFDSNFNFNGMDLNVAKNLAKSITQFFAICPGMKGEFMGVRYRELKDRTYAQNSGTTMTLSTKWGKDEAEFKRQFEIDVASGFHPVGTDYSSIFIHELYHAFIGAIWDDGDVAKVIKKKVMSNYKVKGVKQKDVISQFVSRYGTENADEFGAEAFSRAIRSSDKNNIARAVLKEVVKTSNYQGGHYL